MYKLRKMQHECANQVVYLKKRCSFEWHLMTTRLGGGWWVADDNSWSQSRSQNRIPINKPASDRPPWLVKCCKTLAQKVTLATTSTVGVTKTKEERWDKKHISWTVGHQKQAFSAIHPPLPSKTAVEITVENIDQDKNLDISPYQASCLGYFKQLAHSMFILPTKLDFIGLLDFYRNWILH